MVGHLRQRPVPSANPTAEEPKGLGFYLVLLSLLFEFGRPQDILPGMKAVPFGTLLNGLIAISVIMSGKMSLANLQSRLWLGLLMLMAVHVPFAVNNYWALMILKDMTLCYFLYLGIVAHVNTVDRVKFLINMWLGIHMILAVVGVMQKGRGIGGWMGDENDFGMEMNIALPFAIFLAMSPSTKLPRWAYIAFACTFVLSLMATFSRGGFIGLCAVGGYVLLRSSKKMKAILVLLVLALFMALFAPDQYWDEIRSTTSDEEMQKGTGAQRLYAWGIGWDMFLANPIIGVGQGNYPWTFKEYEGLTSWSGRSLGGRQAHSAYFTLLPELGLVGTCLFLGLLWSVYRDTRVVEMMSRALSRSSVGSTVKPAEDPRAVMFLAQAMEGGIWGFLVSSIFISTLYYPSFWVLMAFMVALRNAVGRLKEQSQPEPQGAVLSRMHLPRMVDRPNKGLA